MSSRRPPERDVARIRQIASERAAAGVPNEARLDVDVDGANVTIVERRPPRTREVEPDWSREPLAQFRYDAAASTWALYWARANGRWQRYDIEPARAIDALIEELQADPDGVFWG